MQHDTGSLYIIIMAGIIVLLVGGLGWEAWIHFGQSSARPLQNTGRVVVSPTPEKSINPVANTHPGRATIWAGYVANGETFTNVEGRVNVPAISCLTADRQENFTAWVGFDGYSTGTVEQAGITATCDNASGYTKNKSVNGVTYYAWSLLYNGGLSKVLDINIKPGDVIFYKVSFSNDKYQLMVTNETTGQTQTDEQTCKQQGSEPGLKPGCARTEAEWIVERSGYSKMANFGIVNLYDNRATTQEGKTGYIEAFNNEMVDMYSSAGVNLAYTTDLLGKGAFKVYWVASGTTGQ